MKYILITVASALLARLVSSRVIPSAFIADYIPVNPKVNSNDTLIFAHVIYRHGDRTWDEPEMQLTKEGKQQLYRTGQFFRKRYHNLTGGKYSPNMVYIVSTDTDRAIMSAQANLAGLFPPTTEEEKWHDEIMWQPVPVHTIPHDQDILLHGGKKCPKYEVLYKYYMERSPEALELMTKYGDLIAYWEEMSGRPLRTIEDVANLYILLISEKGHNNTLDEWAENALKPDQPMQLIVRTTYKLRGTPELARIRSGFLIKDILERSSEKIQSTLRPNLSLYMYSAHSSTLATMLNGLGNFELNIAPFGSSLHFELFKTAKGEYYLQFVYRRLDEENPVPSEIPGCGEKWTLDDFYSAHSDLIPSDFDSECRLSE